MVKLTLLFFCLWLSSVLAEFQAGCTAYEAGNYPEALKEFTAVSQEQCSAELAYNLGCTETKLSHPGRAALWFYRALLLDPQHPESRQNLRFLKKKYGQVSFDATPLDEAARLLSKNLWQALTWAAAWTLVLCVSVLWFLRPKKLWPWITLLCAAFGFGGVSATGWLTSSRQLPPEGIRIVIPDEIKAVNAPAHSADTLIAINPGSQVHPLETQGEWTYLELPGDTATRGWVPTAALEPLWPIPSNTKITRL